MSAHEIEPRSDVHVGNTVTIGWTAPVDSITPTGYVLEGGVSSGAVHASIPTGSAATTFSFVAPSGAFYIRLHAVAGAAKSTASNEIQIFVNAPAPPSPPSGLLGLADGSALTLAWRNPLAGGTPAGIILDVTGAVSTSLTLPLAESFSFAGVPAGTYDFAVRTFNASGRSVASNSVTLTFPGTCAPPATPTAFVATKNPTTISVSWALPNSGPAPTGYILIVRGSLVADIPTAVRTLTGSAGPGSYTLSVAATNPCGTSAATASQIIVIP